jgi:hypothetical protein
MGEANGPIGQSGRKAQFDWKFWLGTLIGVAGIVTGYVFYLWSLTYPEISWWSTGQLVFNSQNSNPAFRLLDRSGKEITENVYATNVSVSNTGTALLERANVVGSLVRTPLVISVSSPKHSEPRILDSSIVGVSERKPVNLGCRISGSNVSVTRDHLDPGSGFRILLLYTAPEQVSPDTNVSISGMRAPSHVDLTQQMTEIPKFPEIDWTFGSLALVVVLTGFGLAAALLAGVGSWVASSTAGGGLKALLFNLSQRLRSFFQRNSKIFESFGSILGWLITHLWIPFVVLAVIVLPVYYRPTLLACWHYYIPSTPQPPLIIATPLNTSCTH